MTRQMPPPSANRVVHLELHTGELAAARALYGRLFDWREERIDTRHGSYLALEMGGDLGGGIVQCPAPRSLWLPYVEVDDVAATTAAACGLGAQLLLAPREGPAGWRSVISSEAGGELALWQPKR